MANYGTFVDGEDDYKEVEASSLEEALDIAELQCRQGAGWRVSSITIGAIAPDGEKLYREIVVDVEEGEVA
jgi:hypothetical protein